MRIEVASIPGGNTAVLAGARLGRKIFSGLVALVASHSSPRGLILLDFAGIEVATASFLREAVIAFRAYCRTAEASLCPVVANPSSAVREELRDFLESRGDAMVACRTDAHGAPIDPEILGKLEAKQSETLSLLLALGSATAPGLAQRSDVGSTAWNNRLSALVSRGLAIEEKSGRRKTFRPVLEGIRHGA